MRELQLFSCHKIDSSLMKQLPVLTDNDFECKQKLEEFQKDLRNGSGQEEAENNRKRLFSNEKGPPEAFLRHGIFPLLFCFSETELKILYFLLCLEPLHFVFQRLFIRSMPISRSHVSTILKKLRLWKLVWCFRAEAADSASVAGRARGRQLIFGISDSARSRLDKDLWEMDFFREEVTRTIRPIALSFSHIHWRKDLGLLDRLAE
jgi:hypothetical protein